jgi:hypothetical protein
MASAFRWCGPSIYSGSVDIRLSGEALRLSQMLAVFKGVEITSA